MREGCGNFYSAVRSLSVSVAAVPFNVICICAHSARRAVFALLDFFEQHIRSRCTGCIRRLLNADLCGMCALQRAGTFVRFSWPTATQDCLFAARPRKMCLVATISSTWWNTRVILRHHEGRAEVSAASRTALYRHNCLAVDFFALLLVRFLSELMGSRILRSSCFMVHMNAHTYTHLLQLCASWHLCSIFAVKGPHTSA